MSLAPFTFAGLYHDEWTDKYGNAHGGLAVRVEQDAEVATIYSDRLGAATAANPATADSRGNLTFFAKPGIYQLVPIIDGLDGDPVVVVVPTDPEDAVAHPTLSQHVTLGLATAEQVAAIPKGDPGAPGAPGVDGADGVGIPTGGVAGQALVKASGVDFETTWGDVATTAAGVTYDNTASGLVGATAQAALDELDGTTDAVTAEVALARGVELDVNDRLVGIEDGVAANGTAITGKENAGVAASAVANHEAAVAPHMGTMRSAKYNGTAWVLESGETFSPTAGVTTVFKVYSGNPAPVVGTAPGQVNAGVDIVIDGAGVVV